MTINILKLTPLLIILTVLSSCFGQNKSTQSQANDLGELTTTMNERIWYVFQDQKDNYWFGSRNDGIYKYDGKTLTHYTQEDGLVNDDIRGIQGDNLGNVFIETPAGVSKYDGKTFSTVLLKKTSANEWQLTPNDLWFNCNGNPNHVYRFDGTYLYELTLPKQNLTEAFGGEVEGLSFSGMNSSPYAVFGIDKDKDGNLWLGTVVAGAFRYDGESFLWFPEKELSTLPDGRVPGVRSMIQDKNGYFWLSNFISKYKISEENDTLRYEKLSGVNQSDKPYEDQLRYFNSSVTDKNEDLWIATYGGGVWKYDGTTLHNFPLYHGNTEVLSVSIYKDNNETLWLGTDNAGVFRYDGTVFRKFEIN